MSGFVVDVVQALVKQGATVSEALSYPPFWGYVGQAMTQSSSLVSLLLAVLFGALGCFSVLRAAFRLSRAPQDGRSRQRRRPQGSPGAQPTLMNPNPAPVNPEGTPAIPAPPTPPRSRRPPRLHVTPPLYGERVPDPNDDQK